MCLLVFVYFPAAMIFADTFTTNQLITDLPFAVVFVCCWYFHYWSANHRPALRGALQRNPISRKPHYSWEGSEGSHKFKEQTNRSLNRSLECIVRKELWTQIVFRKNGLTTSKTSLPTSRILTPVILCAYDVQCCASTKKGPMITHQTLSISMGGHTIHWGSHPTRNTFHEIRQIHR